MPSFLEEATRIAEEFELTQQDVQHATDHFVDRMTAGLQDPTAICTQIPSFVTQVPDGTEKGVYLAADLGGTNFRVCIVELHGLSSYTVKQSKTPVPQSLMTTSSWRPLFAFLAEHIKLFLQLHDWEFGFSGSRPRECFRRLGFTFSFTVEQTSLNTGTLLKWDKGFHIADAIGKDPCDMLQEQLDDLQVPALVSALANDTVATYMAQQYVSGGNAVIGAVFGTGTNAAYLEELSNITKIDGYQSSGRKHMIINTEWGGFDDETYLLPATQYDVELDRSSLNPGEQRYEKLVSGMYLGEIFRRAVLSARNRSSSCSRSTLANSSPLYQEWQIPTSLLSTLTGESLAGHEQYQLALQSALGAKSMTSGEIEGMKMLADAIGLRAARLAGAAISAVILKKDALQKRPIALLPQPKVFTVLSYPCKAPKLVTKLCSFHLRRWLSLKAVKLRLRGSNENTFIDVGLDGTLAASYPGFIEGIRSTFRDVAGIAREGNKRIRISMVADGSSVGTALIAMAAERQAKCV